MTGIVERIEHGDVEGIRVGRFPTQVNSTCIVYLSILKTRSALIPKNLEPITSPGISVG